MSWKLEILMLFYLPYVKEKDSSIFLLVLNIVFLVSYSIINCLDSGSYTHYPIITDLANVTNGFLIVRCKGDFSTLILLDLFTIFVNDNSLFPAIPNSWPTGHQILQLFFFLLWVPILAAAQQILMFPRVCIILIFSLYTFPQTIKFTLKFSNIIYILITPISISLTYITHLGLRFKY